MIVYSGEVESGSREKRRFAIRARKIERSTAA
jgi:hypothetical protein